MDFYPLYDELLILFNKKRKDFEIIAKDKMLASRNRENIHFLLLEYNKMAEISRLCEESVSKQTRLCHQQINNNLWLLDEANTELENSGSQCLYFNYKTRI